MSSIPKIMTVNGPTDANKLGKTLSHEHILVDFVGAEKVSPERLRSPGESRVRNVAIRIFRHPRGIPQYTLGHVGRVETVDRRLRDFPGLAIIGSSAEEPDTMLAPLDDDKDDFDFAKTEALLRGLMIEGIVAIQSGEKPQLIKEKLKGFLAPSLREAVES